MNFENRYPQYSGPFGQISIKKVFEHENIQFHDFPVIGVAKSPLIIDNLIKSYIFHKKYVFWK